MSLCIILAGFVMGRGVPLEAPDGIGSLGWTIIGALVATIIALAGTAKMLFSSYKQAEKEAKECLEARAKFAQDQLILMQTMKREFDKPRGSP